MVDGGLDHSSSPQSSVFILICFFPISFSPSTSSLLSRFILFHFWFDIAILFQRTPTVLALSSALGLPGTQTLLSDTEKGEGKKRKEKTRAESRSRLKLSPSSSPHQLSLLSPSSPSFISLQPPSPSSFLSFSLRIVLQLFLVKHPLRKTHSKNVLSFVSPARTRSAFLDSFRPSPLTS